MTCEGGAYFGRKVVGRPTECPCGIWAVLSKSKVGKLDVPIAVQENVFGLEIAIYDVSRVKVVER